MCAFPLEKGTEKSTYHKSTEPTVVEGKIYKAPFLNSVALPKPHTDCRALRQRPNWTPDALPADPLATSTHRFTIARSTLLYPKENSKYTRGGGGASKKKRKQQEETRSAHLHSVTPRSAARIGVFLPIFVTCHPCPLLRPHHSAPPPLVPFWYQGQEAADANGALSFAMIPHTRLFRNDTSLSLPLSFSLSFSLLFVGQRTPHRDNVTTPPPHPPLPRILPGTTSLTRSVKHRRGQRNKTANRQEATWQNCYTQIPLPLPSTPQPPHSLSCCARACAGESLPHSQQLRRQRIK